MGISHTEYTEILQNNVGLCYPCFIIWFVIQNFTINEDRLNLPIHVYVAEMIDIMHWKVYIQFKFFILIAMIRKLFLLKYHTVIALLWETTPNELKS